MVEREDRLIARRHPDPPRPLDREAAGAGVRGPAAGMAVKIPRAGGPSQPAVSPTRSFRRHSPRIHPNNSQMDCPALTCSENPSRPYRVSGGIPNTSNIVALKSSGETGLSLT